MARPQPDRPGAYDAVFFDNHRPGSISSASRMAPLILELVAARSVIDVGCGLGTWLKVFRDFGVEDAAGVDGPWVAPEQLLIPRERFVATDLTKDLPVNRLFDLAISMEVAEHLPPSAADRFIDSLTRLAPVVVFSAAVPGQGGTDHLNEQWPAYWAERFERAGFRAIDCIRRRVWSDPAVEWWYAQNTIMYASPEGFARHPRLRDAGETGLPVDPRPMALVHPTCLSTHLNQPMGLRRIVSDLPGALRSAVRARTAR